MTLRALHVIPSVAMSEGGPSVAIREMERGLSSAGVSVFTLTSDHGRNTRERAEVARRMYAPLVSRPYKVAPAMVGWLRANIASFDIVHIHALFSFAPTAAAWSARRAGVPYVVRPLGTLAHYGITSRRRLLKKLSMHFIERRMLADAAAVHFTSNAERLEAEDLGLVFRGAVVPLGIELPEWDGGRAAALQQLRTQYPAIGTRRIILFLSRIDPKKNIEALIDAFAASDPLRRTCALLVAGGGEPKYIANLERRAREANVGEQLVFMGPVTGEAKIRLLAAADIFALPSHSENFGIAAVEALQFGLPAVLSRGVAVASEVAEAQAGLVTAPEARELARALELLADDPDLRQVLSGRARALWARKFSTDAMTRNLIALYESIVSGRAVTGEDQGS